MDAQTMLDGTQLQSLTITAGTRTLPFHIRPNTTDELVARQIFVEKHYDLQRLARARELLEYCQRETQRGRRPLVIDAGSNVGASPLWFSLAIHRSKVVAVEPSEGSFELLALNSRGHDIKCLHAAVTAAPGRVHMVDPGMGPIGYRAEVSTDGSGAIPSVTISDLMAAEEPECFPFIVKVDIEGGEGNLFSSNTDWMARTPIIIAEPHDWLLTGTATFRNFLKCVSALDRDFIISGPNVWSISNTLAS